MNKSELVQYLYAMEKQTREIENQNSRLRSIQKSVEKLKQEQSFAPPKKPFLSEPKQVKEFDWGSAIIAWIVTFLLTLLFTIPFAVSSHAVSSGGDIALVFLFILPIACAWGTGKFMAKKAKEAAWEKEALYVKAEQKRWKMQMRHYYSRKQQIPTELAQLQSNYRAAEQAKKQAQSKLTQYGNSIGLHSHYWSTHVLHEIWTLLDRGRADTLKEAINRYEADDSQRRHNEEMAYYASEQADAERRRAQAAEKQAEYARQQAAYSEQQSEYARQQAENTEAVRKDVAKMRSDQEWDRIDRILNH